MGGKALKNTETRRYDKREFLDLSSEIVSTLDKSGLFGLKTIPLYYREKETFGDIDIVISWNTLSEDREDELIKYIEDTFEPNEIYHTKNSNSWSFDYKECQIDFILCEKEDFWCYYHYFSYNDLGNFIGVIARNLGLKYGQEGLVYDHYFKGRNIGRISVSKDYFKIFRFLDLDYGRFMRGFDNMSEVVDFVASSKYFNYDSFQLSNLNKVNRERNLKRESYMFMLQYIEEHYSDRKYEIPEDKTKLVRQAESFFDEFEFTFKTREMEYEYTKKLYVQSKFSVRNIINLTGNNNGAECAQMYEFYRIYLYQINKGDIEGFLLNNDREFIENHFMEFMNLNQAEKTGK